MLLKIFTKRKPGGELVETDHQWKDEYIEADTVKLTPIKAGFEFYCQSQGEQVSAGGFSLDKYGYELRNDKGVIIERYVTTTK